MTLSKFLKSGIQFLEKKGIKDAKNDATLIFLKSFDLTLAKYLTIKDMNMLVLNSNVKEWDNKINNYNNNIVKRAKHIPLQYILNEAYFYGLKFYVDSNVLIPRQDSEVLVDLVLKENDLNNKKLLDLCTGSGVIGISIAKNSKLCELILADISTCALNIAKMNADLLLNNYSVEYLETNMFSTIKEFLTKKDYNSFDIITINPPYINTSTIALLDKEVKDNEPIISLDGGEDGLDFYRIIFDEISAYMNDNTKVYMEIGYDQASDIKNLFNNTIYKNFRVIKDLSYNDRVVVFEK